MISIKEQLKVVTGAFGYVYGPGAMHEWVLERLSDALSKLGLSDIRDLGLADQIYANGTCAIPYKEWINKRTGAPLPYLVHLGDAQYIVTQGILAVGGGNPNRTFECWQGTVCEIEVPGGWIEKRCVRLGATQENQLFETIGRWGGDGNDTDISVYAKFTNDGIPYFLVARTPHRSSRDTFKQFLSLAVVAASFAIPGLGPTLTSGLFGSFATAYPAVASALTNVAIQTALNGGDIESAVQNAAASALSSGFGNFVKGVSDSAAIGALSNVAMRAAVQGESVSDAVQGAALSLVPAALSDAGDFFASSEIATDAAEIYDPGVPESAPTFAQGETAVSIFDIPTSAPTQDWDPLYTAANAAPSLDEIASWAPATVDFGTVFDNGSVPMSAPIFEPLGYSLDDLFQSATGVSASSVPENAPAAATGLPDAVASAPEAVDVPASSFFDDVTWDDTVDRLTGLAIAAIRVHQAYQAANQPPVQPAVSTTRAGGTRAARSDGTLATTDPATGRVVVTRPPAGVPYELPNGAGAVINNGNGTYTVVSPTGQTAIRSYASDVPLSGVARVQAATWIEGVPNWAVVAAGVGALALITRR